MEVQRIQPSEVSNGRGSLQGELTQLYDAAKSEPGQWFRASCPNASPVQTLRKFPHLEVRAKKDKAKNVVNIDIRYNPDFSYVAKTRAPRKPKAPKDGAALTQAQ